MDLTPQRNRKEQTLFDRIQEEDRVLARMFSKERLTNAKALEKSVFVPRKSIELIRKNGHGVRVEWDPRDHCRGDDRIPFGEIDDEWWTWMIDVDASGGENKIQIPMLYRIKYGVRTLIQRD